MCAYAQSHCTRFYFRTKKIFSIKGNTVKQSLRTVNFLITFKLCTRGTSNEVSFQFGEIHLKRTKRCRAMLRFYVETLLVL